MARYGINTERACGVPLSALRGFAKGRKRDHVLAAQLWATGIREGRLLAVLVEDPRQVTPEQMDAWAKDFDSWDLCDGACSLFSYSPHGFAKAMEWSSRPEEYVKRAAFALMASLAVHANKAPDKDFEALLPVIRREAGDDRDYVRKVVNWALRQIGKRCRRLNAAATACAREIQADGTKAGRWVVSDALRELTGAAVQAKLARGGKGTSEGVSPGSSVVRVNIETPGANQRLTGGGLEGPPAHCYSVRNHL
jgi:3-methyladenine DNA glycosylase AlkD